MKKFSFPLIVLLSITAMSSCRNKQAEVNPLLAPWDTPYEVPPFDKIEIRHYKPAVEQAIVRHQKEIDSIASNPAAPDFENTIAALDRSGETLDRVYTTFSTFATPAMVVFSTFVTSFTLVPGFLSRLESTSRSTRNFFASSTLRLWSTPAP